VAFREIFFGWIKSYVILKAIQILWSYRAKSFFNLFLSMKTRVFNLKPKELYHLKAVLWKTTSFSEQLLLLTENQVNKNATSV
jgi:hypothetical protein